MNHPHDPAIAHYGTLAAQAQAQDFKPVACLRPQAAPACWQEDNRHRDFDEYVLVDFADEQIPFSIRSDWSEKLDDEGHRVHTYVVKELFVASNADLLALFEAVAKESPTMRSLLHRVRSEGEEAARDLL
jgi:hypothetical protein